MGLDQWLIFVVVWTAAGLPLGPNALNCIALSASDGFCRSLWAVVGILLAAVCHMAATILGVATVLLANAALFQVLKLIGAAYLIWMGISLWRRKDVMPSAGRRETATPWRSVRRGFVISMSNPKAILAYLAVFSQFVKPDVPLTAQLVVLVPTAQAITALVYVGYSALGLGVGRFLNSAKRRTCFNRSVGSAYILAGAGLASTGR